MGDWVPWLPSAGGVPGKAKNNPGRWKTREKTAKESKPGRVPKTRPSGFRFRIH